MDWVEGLREGSYVEQIWIRTVREAKKLSYQSIPTVAALLLLSEFSPLMGTVGMLYNNTKRRMSRDARGGNAFKTPIAISRVPRVMSQLSR